MKHTLKKTLMLMVCAMLLVCAGLLLSACGEPTVTPGTIGGEDGTDYVGDSQPIQTGLCEDDGLTWTLYENGLLSIMGTPTTSNGEMWNYELYNTTPPWKNYADQVKSLELDDGIVGICSEAFSGMKNLIWADLGTGVVTIGDGAFKNCTNLRRVVLPASVTTIGNTAFRGCYRMYELNMKDSALTTIGTDAFSGCYSLVTVSLPSTLLTTGVPAGTFSDCQKIVEVIVAQTNITRGDATAFGGVAANALEVHSNDSKIIKTEDGYLFWQTRLLGYNGNAETLILPTNTTNIAPYAFYANTSVKTLVVGDSVTIIGNYAFASCDSLESLTIGTNVVSIGSSGVFDNCRNLKNLTYNAKNCSACNVSNCRWCTAGILSDTALENLTLGDAVVTLPARLFKGCTKLARVDLPSNINTISASLFEGCTALTNVSFGSAVTWIEESAFRNCVSLTAFDLAKLTRVDSIGASAFYGCRSLVVADFTNVSRVSSYAYGSCTSLTSVTIGPSTSFVGSDTFRGCHKLMDVVNNHTINTYTKGTSYGGYVAYYTLFDVVKGSSRLQNVNDFLFMTDNGKNYLVGYIGTSKNLTLPADYNGSSYEINAHAFDSNLGLETITLSAGVTAIGAEAFADCASLKTVNMVANSAVTVIGNAAFSGCRVLEEVSLRAPLAKIGDDAFNGCQKLAVVSVPNTVISLGERAFKDSGLTKATLGTGVTILPKALFSGCKNLSEVTLAEGTTIIGENTFANCIAITNIALPATLEKIDKCAFYSCAALQTMVLPASVQTIGLEAFNGCVNLYSFTVGEGVTEIGARAFNNCQNLLEVIDKAQNENFVIEIGKDGTGYISAYAKRIASDSSVVDLEGDYIYMEMDGATYLAGYLGTDKVLTLPSTLNGGSYSLLSYAFYGKDITEITIDGGVTEIGGSAFKNSNLKKIVIGGTVASIGSYAFSGTPLVDLEIKEGVRTIAAAAFEHCEELKTVKIPDSVRSIGVAAFRGCHKLSQISFGTNPATASRLASLGSYVFDDCYSLTHIVLPRSLTSLGREWCSNCPKLVEIVNLSGIILNKNDLWFKNVLSFVNYSANWERNSRIDIIEGVTGATDGLVFFTHNSAVYLVGYVGSDTNVVLPSGYSGNSYKIYPYALYGCDMIESVSIPRGVTAVGNNAFEGCTSLKSIYMSNTFVSQDGVGADVFANCSNTLLVVSAYTVAADIPESWDENWNRRANGEWYVVYYGYTEEQYLALVER